jgi:hypothetical protein
MVASQASVRSAGYTQTHAKEQRAKSKNQKSKIKDQRSKIKDQRLPHNPHSLDQSLPQAANPNQNRFREVE